MKWILEYDNDETANGDGFMEWWTVSESNGEKTFDCHNKKDAEWLCDFLNKSQSLSTETGQQGVEYVRYFLEKVDTQEWYSIANLELRPLPHEEFWTNDPLMALSINDKKWAEEWRDKYFNYPNYKITEHIFCSPSQPQEVGQDELWEEFARDWDDFTSHDMRQRKSSFEKLKSKFTLIKK